uniref:ABC transporter ATP-binding protein n=1 Tax=Fervidicoccus fontis TaxID=683846 RepID=A0A7J3ZL67_9CREN
MLEVSSVSAGYGKLQVLFDVSATFPSGKITVVVGPNGSGKSTLLKTIYGLTRIYKGKIEFEGQDITKIQPHQKVAKGIVYLPQTDNVFDNLTVNENLRIAGYTLPKEELEERVERALEIFPILRGYMKRKAKHLSGGEKQMLAIAMALIKKPKLIMLDEPTAALAPKVAYQIINVIERLKNELGLTIVLVEQNAKVALKIGDKAILMVGGRVLYEGSPERLLRDPEFGPTYLGLRGATER